MCTCGVFGGVYLDIAHCIFVGNHLKCILQQLEGIILTDLPQKADSGLRSHQLTTRGLGTASVRIDKLCEKWSGEAAVL